jgi:hypothetical protein
MDILGLDPAMGWFFIEVGGVDFAGAAAGLPDALAIGLAGKVTLFPAATANPRKFMLAVTAKNGAANGGFTLSDGRRANFSASLRPAPATSDAVDIGRGFFIVPPAAKGGESSIGEIRLIAPGEGASPPHVAPPGL